MCNEEKLGYLIGKHEGLETEVKEIRKELSGHMAHEEADRKVQHEKMDRILRELSYYRIAVDIIKTSVYGLLAALVFWFDKILTWFKG